MNYYTADIHDADPEAGRLCEIDFRSYGAPHPFGGPCVTLKVHEDHRIGVKLFAEPGMGRVLVIDGGGLTRIALLGATMAANAVRNGWAGAIVYGAIRDIDELRGIGLPVKALRTTSRKSPAPTKHQLDVPLTFGGVTFNPGEWVYADGDGVLVRSTRYVPKPKSSAPSEY